VETVRPEALAEEVDRFHPRVVISSRSRIASLNRVLVWVELSLDPTRPTKIHVGGRCTEIINPTLERLLTIIDELEQSTRMNDDN
jgi:hypothetical protein